MTPLLGTNDLSVRYGGLAAVDRVSLMVAEGSVVGLIGPNGAGKTTFIDVVTGFVRASGGLVRFAGRTITREPPDRRARLGLARTFQSLELFDDLTVRENLLVSCERSRWWSFLRNVAAPGVGATPEGVAWALELLELGDAADRTPAELSHGRRKAVSVARSIAPRPRLALLDEPAAGLDSHESKMLGQRLRRLVDAGITVFLVDHDMHLVLGICDYIYVLEFGGLLAEGTPKEIRQHPAVITAYLGEHTPAAANADAIAVGDLPEDSS